MTVLVSDSFNRANTTNGLGSTDSASGGTAYSWITNIGTAVWGISSNQAYTSTGANDSPAVVDMTTQADNVRVSIDIQTSNSVYQMGVAFRVQDNRNYFRAYATTNVVKIDQVVNGTVTNIMNQSLSPTVTFPATLSIELSGSTINALINGVQKATVTNTNLQTATKHGMYLGNTTTYMLDNFKIESLTSTGTTYVGSGTSAGVGSASDTNTFIGATTTYTGGGTATGAGSTSDTNHLTLASSGTVTGSSSASDTSHLIFASRGIANGVGSDSDTNKMLMVAGGTAMGFSSPYSNEKGSMLWSKVLINTDTWNKASINQVTWNKSTPITTSWKEG